MRDILERLRETDKEKILFGPAVTKEECAVEIENLRGEKEQIQIKYAEMKTQRNLYHKEMWGARNELAEERKSQEWQPIDKCQLVNNPRKRVAWKNCNGYWVTTVAQYYPKFSLPMDSDYAEDGEWHEGQGEYFAPRGWYECSQSDEPMQPITPELFHDLPEAPKGES